MATRTRVPTKTIQDLLAGAIDVIDRADRLLGKVDLIRYMGILCGSANPIDTQIIVGGVPVDPRARTWVLNQLTDSVQVAPILGGVWDVSDRWARQLGQIDLARVLGVALTVANPVISGIYDAVGNRMPAMDNALRPGYQDIIDRWARQLGAVDLARVLGAALSAANPVISGIYDAAGNRMPSADAVARALYANVSPVAATTWDVSDRWLRQLGQVDLARVLGVALTSTNPVIAGIYDALGNRMPSMDAVARPGYVDVIDRAARLLGTVSPVAGSVWDVSDRWARQLGQVDLSRVLGAALSAANPVIAGLYDAAGNRMPSMDAVARRGYQAITDGTETLSIDASNRAETAPVQTTRTNLTVKGEREDTALVYNTFVAGGASDVAVLAAGGGLLKHKVYSCGYTIDAAVQAGFRFNSANPRFCVRRTAGVFAQTFSHPIVSAADVTLTLRVEGACNGDFWCQYVTE